MANKKKERSLSLRLEIALDGKDAGIFQGQLLVYGIHYKASKGVFEIIPINEEYELMLAVNDYVKGYINKALQVLTAYREEAQHLIDRRDALELAFKD